MKDRIVVLFLITMYCCQFTLAKEVIKVELLTCHQPTLPLDVYITEVYEKDSLVASSFGQELIWRRDSLQRLRILTPFGLAIDTIVPPSINYIAICADDYVPAKVDRTGTLAEKMGAGDSLMIFYSQGACAGRSLELMIVKKVGNGCRIDAYHRTRFDTSRQALIKLAGYSVHLNGQGEKEKRHYEIPFDSLKFHKTMSESMALDYLAIFEKETKLMSKHYKSVNTWSATNQLFLNSDTVTIGHQGAGQRNLTTYKVLKDRLQKNTPLQTTVLPTDEKRIVSIAKKYGMTDRKGNILIPIKYDFLGFNRQNKHGWHWAILNGKYGFFKDDGSIAVPLLYSSIEYFIGEVTVAMKEGKVGLINKEGQEITPFIYDKAEDIKRGYFKVCLEGKCGAANTKGKIVVPLKYKWVGCAKSDGFRARLGDKIILLNKRGKEIGEEMK